jgi:uncharacterized membrane protein
MMNSFLFVLTLLAALGCAMMAGVFLAFSAFVMKALARLPAQQGIGAMQAINVAAVTFAFMAALFGTAAACLGLLVWAVISWGEPPATLVFSAGVLYLVGAIGVTMARNVPLNNRLAKLHPQSTNAAGYWDEYVTKWTGWNHVRTVAALVAAALLTVALHV